MHWFAGIGKLNCVGLCVNANLIFILRYTFVIHTYDKRVVIITTTHFFPICINIHHTCANQRRTESKVTNKKKENHLFYLFIFFFNVDDNGRIYFLW